MIKEFISAAGAYLQALELTIRYRLWGYFLAPAIISVLLAAAIFTTAWQLSDNIAAWVVGWYPWEQGKGVVDRVAQVFAGLTVGAIGLILFKNLVIALASPFMSFLSEKVERKLHDAPEIKFSIGQALSDLVRGLTIAIRLIVRELLFTVLLLLLGLVPVFSPFTPVLIFLVQSYYAGAGNLDFALERHFRVRGSIRFMRKHRGLALGNGMVYLLLFVTVIGFPFALPLSTIAGTIETVRYVDEEKL